jgi:hypothetical protein
MKRVALDRIVWVLLLAVIGPARVQGQVEAGTVAAVVGKLEVQRGGTWQAATVGAPVFAGDRLRSAEGDQAKIVFRDDSVLDIGPGTDILLDTQVFDPAAHRYQSLLRLAKGKIRAWVSDYYREPRARYGVETPTAVANVSGTELIALYVPASETTDVVALVGQIDVTGKLAVLGGGVQVGPRSYTSVQKGRFPSPPAPLDEAQLRQHLQGLDIVGTGRHDGLNVLHPAIAGRLLSPQDVPGPARGQEAGETAEGLVIGAPEDSLAYRLSPDVRANTQPLRDFKLVPPGRSPSGSVKVSF